MIGTRGPQPQTGISPHAVHRSLLLALLLSVGLAWPAAAIQFAYSHSFQTGAFGPDRGAAGEGTPRGLTVGAAGNVLIADSLDDQIYEADPSGNLQRAMQTNPYCEVSGPPTCVPGTPSHGAFFADAIATQAGSGHIWLLEDPNSGPTLLQELDGDGLFLSEWNVSSSLGDGGGMAFDSRNGDILVTRLSSGSSIVRLDENDPGGLALAFHSLPVTTAPTGLTEFAPGVFLVVDAVANTIYEYSVPAGTGAATLLGESVLSGFDLTTTDALGLAYDPASQRLYVADNNLGDSVHVFDLVPEPATGTLAMSGLAGLAVWRRRQRLQTHAH